MRYSERVQVISLQHTTTARYFISQPIHKHMDSLREARVKSFVHLITTHPQKVHTAANASSSQGYAGLRSTLTVPAMSAVRKAVAEVQDRLLKPPLMRVLEISPSLSLLTVECHFLLGALHFCWEGVKCFYFLQGFFSQRSCCFRLSAEGPASHKGRSNFPDLPDRRRSGLAGSGLLSLPLVESLCQLYNLREPQLHYFGRFHTE